MKKYAAIYYILYLSVADTPVTNDELEKILSVSRRNNKSASITGILLYGNGRFIQLLEGVRPDVEERFQVIKADSRHLDVTVIAWGEISERCFPDWLMGFKSIRPEAKSTIDDFLELSKKSVEKEMTANTRSGYYSHLCGRISWMPDVINLPRQYELRNTSNRMVSMAVKSHDDEHFSFKLCC